MPGRCAIGDAELELHAAAGHTGDGMAIRVPWAGVLIAGDYLSPIEIPTLGEGGSLDAYRQTLERLEPLVGSAEHVVPGHGPVLGPEAAARVCAEHLAYLQDLAARGQDAALPQGRRTREQRRLHAENASRL